jgi:ribosomal-protein-alanine N-acetyltransferase
VPGPFPLTTPRLTLRRMTVDDAGLFYDLDRDPAVTRFVGGPMATVNEYRDKIANEFAPYAEARPIRGLFAVEDRATGVFMGWYLLRPATTYRFAAVTGWNDPTHTEIGYRFAQESWGRGVATEGARALIDFVFADPTVTAVVACALVANVGSWRVMEKVGMTESGRCELPGYGPAVTYRLNRR